MSGWGIDQKKEELMILDPSAGFGVFERAIAEIEKDKRLKYHLWEIDKDILKYLRNVCQKLNIDTQFYNEDFLLSSWDKKYDLIIANPPYYKHHHIKDKDKITSLVSSKLLFPFSVQTNIYCWFFLKALHQLEDKGKLAFIIPSEFLNSNYGEAIKKYLMNTYFKIFFVNIDFNERAFDGVMTTALLVFIEKCDVEKTEFRFYNVNKINELTNPTSFFEKYPYKVIPDAELNYKVKWRNYFNGNKNKQALEYLIPFKDYGKFSRGIATGSNQYFTLTKAEAIENGLPEIALIPCITKAANIKNIIFTEDDFLKQKREGKKVYLFDGQKSDKESVIKYIKRGEYLGIQKTFLTKNRDPWYALEKRDISKIWASVFGRVGLKFIWNQSRCLTLTCFHNLFLNEKGRNYLDILFIYLQTNYAKQLFDYEKREYGDGLEKFEPNDINKSLIPNFDLLDKKSLTKLKELQTTLINVTGDENDEIIRSADKIFNMVFPLNL